jgi:predicted amidohydrolase
MFEEKIWSINGSTDLIILPEMFTTGFTMEAATQAEPYGSTTFHWMKQMAAQTQAAICGSYIVKQGDAFFNRLVWINPDGSDFFYDKRHLFRMAQEHLTYTAGQELLIVDWKGWKVCPQICYDLRFPIWNRNRWDQQQQRLEYDLLIFVANWPRPRVNAWDTLLQARAIENLCYSIGVNRIGEDEAGMSYCGHSCIVNHKGHLLKHLQDEEEVFTLELSGQELEAFRKKFPVYKDADNFEILTDDQ